MTDLIKKLFATTLAVCIISISFAQQVELDKIVPASPEMAQLTKQVNTPVDLSTGSVSIQVPIYTIQTKNFQWPISFSYNGGGIRVDEISSSVGLGWVLNGTGVVSRSIAGTTDESGGMLYNNVPYTTAEFYQLTQQQQQAMVQTVLAGADSEPDKFSFSVNGKSGSFYRHRTDGILLQSYNDVKVSFNGNNPIITDDQGNKYYFEAYESGVARNNILKDDGTLSDITESYDGITGWYLTKVVSQDLSDEIEFVYNGLYTVRQEQEAYSFKVGQLGSTNNQMCVIGLQQPIVKKTSIQVTSTNVPILSEIKFKNGKVVFNYLQDRQDMNGGSTPVGNQGRLASVSIYTLSGETYDLYQKALLSQSYFSTTVPADKNPSFGYRLKLDAVTMLDKNNVSLLPPFSFEYNSNGLPYRTSPAQDFWGYYNGATGNTSLVPNRIIEWNENGNSSIYNIGTANRQPSEDKMQACLLNKIVYPTGGYTTFEYEANRYYDPNLNSTVTPATTAPVTHTLTATPGTATHNPKVRFVNDGPSQQVTINGFFKAFYGKSDLPPYMKIKKVETSTTFSNVLTLVSSDDHNDRNETALYNLIAGAEYELEAYVHAGSYPIEEIWSTIQLTRTRIVDPGGTVVTGGNRIIGGLRIKSKSDYSATGEIALKEVFSYGSDGEGIPITHLGVFNRQYRNVYDRVTVTPTNGGCIECPIFNYRVYTDQSPYAASTISGSLVGYSRVQKTQVDKSDIALGMQVYYYNILTDDFDVFPNTDNYYPLSKDWQNNKLWKEETYRREPNGNIFLIQSKENYYSDYKKDTMYNLMVLPKALTSCFPTDIFNYNIFQGRKYLGKKLLTQTVTTVRNKNGSNEINVLTDTVNYLYSTVSSHTNPIKISKKSSTQKALDEYNYYPEDMINLLNDAGNGLYASMVQKGLIGSLILKIKKTNTVSTKETKIDYASPYNTFIKPSAISVKNGSSPLDLYKKTEYLENGNIKQQSLKNNINETYVWSYNSQYPVAKIIGSDYVTVMTKITQVQIDAATGIANNDADVRSLLNNIRNGFAGNKTVQVFTYTYSPLIGVTSETDPNGKAIYYEYDGLGRLKLIRDQDNNIIKTFDYKYQQAIGN